MGCSWVQAAPGCRCRGPASAARSRAAGRSRCSCARRPHARVQTRDPVMHTMQPCTAARTYTQPDWTRQLFVLWRHARRAAPAAVTTRACGDRVLYVDLTLLCIGSAAKAGAQAARPSRARLAQAAYAAGTRACSTRAACSGTSHAPLSPGTNVKLPRRRSRRGRPLMSGQSRSTQCACARALWARRAG